MSESEAHKVIVATAKFEPLWWSDYPAFGYWDTTGKLNHDYAIHVCDDGTFSVCQSEGVKRRETFNTLDEAKMYLNAIEARRQAGEKI